MVQVILTLRWERQLAPSPHYTSGSIHVRVPRQFSVSTDFLKIMHMWPEKDESGICLPFKESQQCRHASSGLLFEGDAGVLGCCGHRGGIATVSNGTTQQARCCAASDQRRAFLQNRSPQGSGEESPSLSQACRCQVTAHRAGLL